MFRGLIVLVYSYIYSNHRYPLVWNSNIPWRNDSAPQSAAFKPRMKFFEKSGKIRNIDLLRYIKWRQAAWEKRRLFLLVNFTSRIGSFLILNISIALENDTKRFQINNIYWAITITFVSVFLSKKTAWLFLRNKGMEAKMSMDPYL